MSRAQTVWAMSTVVATAVAFMLFSYLPFSFWVDGAIAAVAFFTIAGFGHRYFQKHATAEEIRRDLEDRKNFPG
ncbi:MAG: hypothetical protein AB7F09_23290 [Parvibaculaceae bacterium]